MASQTSVNVLLNITELKENINEVFLLTMSIFILLMQAGFALLEAGSIRSKNVTNIMMKNVMDIFISCLSYWTVGYALAYGEGNSFLGYTYWASAGLPSSQVAHFFFQFVFAATAATIVSGAVAERCNFWAYITYSAVISGFVYPVVSHWAWGTNGWLSTLGYTDFAGSGVVHLVGGTCSLVAALLLGPRMGRFDGKEMPGHSTPFLGLGGMILIAGFLAFNGGSLGNMTTPNAGATIAKVISNTIMAGTGGAVLVMVLSKCGLVESGVKNWNFSITLNASLAGMVSICASADQQLLWAALVTGAFGSLFFLVFHRLIPACKIDDPVDAIAVHFGGGLWGIIAGPILREGGIVYTPSKANFMALAYNLAGGAAIIAWSLVTSLIMFYILKKIKKLRVSPEAEEEGLDLAKHREPAYPSSAWKAGNVMKMKDVEVGKYVNKSNEHYHNLGYKHDNEKNIS